MDGDETYEYSGSDQEFPNEATRKIARRTAGVPPERFTHAAQAAVEEIYDEPKKRNEALSGNNKTDWKRAMDDEVK